MQRSSVLALEAAARLLAAREPRATPLARQLSSLCHQAAQGASLACQTPACGLGAGWALQRTAWRTPPSSPACHALLRRLSTASEEAAAADAAVHDTLRPKVLRFFAFFMICTAGANVLPAVAAALVTNCLALLEAQQPFMVKAGCSRLQLLMRLDAARSRAVDEGAARRLLRLVQAPDADAGVVDYALSALEALAGSEKGLAAVAADGGGAALESYLAGAERSPASEDAVARAQRLLAALAAVAIFD